MPQGVWAPGDAGIKKGLVESRGAEMLDEEYGEGDQGIVLVSLSFGRFAFVGA